jgi:branched-subunit amino acid transport protein AzlD
MYTIYKTGWIFLSRFCNSYSLTLCSSYFNQFVICIPELFPNAVFIWSAVSCYWDHKCCCDGVIGMSIKMGVLFMITFFLSLCRIMPFDIWNYDSYTQLVGLLGWGMSLLQHRTAQRKSADICPHIKWGSDPWSQCLSGAGISCLRPHSHCDWNLWI